VLVTLAEHRHLRLVVRPSFDYHPLNDLPRASTRDVCP
jgi:hypothetical protein